MFNTYTNVRVYYDNDNILFDHNIQIYTTYKTVKPHELFATFSLPLSDPVHVFARRIPPVGEMQ